MRPPLIPQPIPFYDHDSELTQALKTIFNSLVDYREPKSGRIVVSLFMCLPSRRDFPEYFNIIHKPISMLSIRKRIENNQYHQIESCLNDYKLMFNNCRTFNEDGSIIFDDSKVLEKIVQDGYNQYRVKNNLPATNGIGEHHSNNHQLKSTITKTKTLSRNSSLANDTLDRHSPHHKFTPNNGYQSKTHQLLGIRDRSHHRHSTPLKLTPRHERHLNNSRMQTNHLNNNSLTTTNKTNNQNNHFHPSTNGFTSDDSNSMMMMNSTTKTTGRSFFNEDSLAENPTILGSLNNDSISMDSNSTAATNNHDSQSQPPQSQQQQQRSHSRSTKRMKRDHDHLKRRALTGYIIYAAEVRKEYVDKNPNQEFGFISKLIGNDWRALPDDLKQKYEQRATVQNAIYAKEVARRERLRAAQMEAEAAAAALNPQNNDCRTSMNGFSQDGSAVGSAADGTTSSAMQLRNKNQRVGGQQIPSSPRPVCLAEAATQTLKARFVEPTLKRKYYNHTEIFKRYFGDDFGINYEHVYGHHQEQQQSSTDNHRHSSFAFANNNIHDGPEGSSFNGISRHRTTTTNYHSYRHLEANQAEEWLGAGIGRHKSSGDALWALRDFMLQDAGMMRWSLQPYLQMTGGD